MPCILIVDDEHTILKLAEMALGPLYEVRTAVSGEVAMGLLADHAVDLLVTDQRMPGMSGTELLALARAAQPGLPCLIATGHTGEPELKRAESELGARLLVKPWSPRELRQAVQAALPRTP